MVQTRRPTGAVPWPLILLEGGEKSGKSWKCAELTASPKVGRAFWIDIAETSADEYGAVPGADYEVVVHDGTFASLHTAVADIHAIAAETPPGEPPVLLIIDTMTAEWEWLKDWASDRAKDSDKNRKLLAKDPQVEIVIPPNIWNDTNTRHRRLMRLLMTFKGIVVMVARGKLTIALDENGRPIPNVKDYRVEAQRTLPFDASVWIRLSRDEHPFVVGCRSVHTGVRPGRDAPLSLAEDWSLEWVVFDALRCDPATAHARDLVDRKPEPTPEQIRAEALDPATTLARFRELYELTKSLGFENVLTSDAHGNEGALLALLTYMANQRYPAGDAPSKPPPAGAAQREMLTALFTKAGGFDTSESRGTYIAEVLGRPVTEDDLTVSDAEEVASRLREALVAQGATR